MIDKAHDVMVGGVVTPRMDDVAPRIEHTALGPMTDWQAVMNVLDAALQYGMRACIPPWYLADAREYAPTVDVTTVVGFPHGQSRTAIKCQEAVDAWQQEATEVDMVPNLGALVSGQDDAFVGDIEEVVAAVPIPVKVILEAPLLDEPTLRRGCELAAEADAAYVKTATGFAEGGATVDDVEIMAEYLPVKASGGIRTWEFAADLLDAGAERLGTSSGDQLMEEYRAQADETDE